MIVAGASVLVVTIQIAPGAGATMLNAFCVMLVCVAVLSWSVLWQDSWPKFVGLLVLGVVAAPLPVLTAILALPFGPELAVVSLVLNVTAESTPPGSSVVWQFKPTARSDSDDRFAPGLMHSVTHGDQSVLHQMAAWIQQRVVCGPA